MQGDRLAAGPPECKRSAQASAMKVHRGETPSAARCAARQRASASPGDAQNRGTSNAHLRKPTKPHIQLHAFPSIRRLAHPQIRHSDNAQNRMHDLPQTRTSAKTQALTTRAQARPRPRPSRASATTSERTEQSAPPSGAPGDAQSPLLRDQIRLCVPSSASTRRA